MPGIIAREGIFTNDTLVLLLKKTLLNPTITLPLYLLLTRLPYGQQILASASPDQLKWFGRFKIAVILGVVGRVNHILSKKSQNNWKKDKFDAPREIVVVTGGSGGIGEAMVKGLQGRAGKVVILDLVEPKFKLGEYRRRVVRRGYMMANGFGGDSTECEVL